MSCFGNTENSILQASNCIDFKHWNIQSATYEDISYDNFFNNHLLKNIPCIVKNVSSNWDCTKKWVTNDIINYSYLKEQYGNLTAPVADCFTIKYNSHCKQDMTILDYMNSLENRDKQKVLYLKDWHLKRARPDDHFYKIPQIFSSDWLNEYAQDKNEDDFMFVYIGPINSWTPLHVDVYSSYSWSVNIMGRKRWILFPPGEEEKLKDSLGNLPILFISENHDDITHLDIIQEKGDAIFVPSGWHHQVINEVDTISVNHNWINGCNIITVWEALTRTLKSVEREIEEFKNTDEYTDQCQLILKSLFGMDFDSFVNFLYHIAQKRLSQLQNGDNLNELYLNKNQIKFDLQQVLKVIHLCAIHPVFIKKQNKLNDLLELTYIITSAIK